MTKEPALSLSKGPRRGLFITFEGGEGAGKSTQAQLLVDRLHAAGHTVLLTREPAGIPEGEEVRRILDTWEDLCPQTELFLFAAVRAQHVAQVIRPALARGEIVICDRFSDSTLAYQGYGHGLDLEKIRMVNEMATGSLQPDLTVLLDVPLEIGLARHQAERGEHFARQPLEFHQRVRQGYLKLASEEPGRWRVLDAALPQEQVCEEIWGKVKALLMPPSD